MDVEKDNMENSGGIRNEFSTKTKDTIGRRVGYLCSNPRCRAHTVGPNEDDSKATTVGIAAHISAASHGGPRYRDMDVSERVSAKNGIWLCAICATLIDRNENTYKEELLLKWKREAEEEMFKNISSRLLVKPPKLRPYLEFELSRSLWGRSNEGYSQKNPIEIHDGQPFMVAGENPIIFWRLQWTYVLSIHNNSTLPAYNITIESVGENYLTTMPKLRSKNNLPPFQSMELDAKYQYVIEGTHGEADEILKDNIPERLNGMTLKITYEDDERNSHTMIAAVKNKELLTEYFE